MRKGLQEFLGNGIRFFASVTATTYFGIRLQGNPSSSFYWNAPTSLPGSTQAVVCDSSGNLSYQALGGGGTVTSVNVSLPTSVFSASSGAITSTGTISFTFNNQSANSVFAGPSSGGSGTPSFRTLVAADIPQTLTSSWISNFDTAVRANRLDQLAVPTANVNLNSQRITGLADPQNLQDAATKAYVDAVSQGLDVKTSCRLATTSNLNLSSPGATIDSVAVVSGDRILVKDQTTASQNGIYIWNGSAATMTRATDADVSAEVTAGLFTFVEEGTVNADSGWILTTDGTITLGTTNLTFTQFSGAGQITAGAGLTKSGNTLDIGGTTNRITVNADSIDIASNYVGQNTITTLGTITTGTWNGTAIAVANGGTGATTAATARSNLSAAGVARGTFTNASLVAGVLTVTHSLGNKIVHIQISDENDKVIGPDDIVLTSTTQATIDLTSYGTLTGTWNWIVTG